jgi:hypothetical protein
MRKRCAIWWGSVAAVGMVLAFAEPAQAFYWAGWPGSKIPPERTVIGPQHKDTPGNPPERVPVGPASTASPIPPGQQVPEPASALAAIIGFGALAALRAVRRGKRDRIPE